MKSTDSDEHDRAHESTEDMFHNDNHQIPARRSLSRESHDDTLSEDGCAQPPNESPAPDGDGTILLAPLSGVVAQADLEREVDEDGEREVFLRETFIQQFEVGDGVVGLEADFRNQMDKNERLDILQLQNPAHGFVDAPNAVALFGAVFAFEKCEAEGYGDVGPAPEGEVGV